MPSSILKYGPCLVAVFHTLLPASHYDLEVPTTYEVETVVGIKHYVQTFVGLLNI